MNAQCRVIMCRSRKRSAVKTHQWQIIWGGGGGGRGGGGERGHNIIFSLRLHKEVKKILSDTV